MWVCLQELPWWKRLQLYFRKRAVWMCLLWVCLYPTPLHAFFFTLEISLRLKVWCILAVEGGKLAETARYSSKVARVRISSRGLWVYQFLFMLATSHAQQSRQLGCQVFKCCMPYGRSHFLKAIFILLFRGDATSRVKRGVKRERAGNKCWKIMEWERLEAGQQQR